MFGVALQRFYCAAHGSPITNHDCVKDLKNLFCSIVCYISIIYLDLNVENCITLVSKLLKNAHFSYKFGGTLPRLAVNDLKLDMFHVSIYYRS